MKQIKTIIAIAIFSAIGFSTVKAGDTIVANSTLPVELKYAGSFKNQPIILLNFTGSKDDNAFNIRITDESGVELYNDNVRGEVFTKQFLLNTEDLGDAVLKFEISSRKTGKSATYQVNRQRLVSEQTNIVKL
jgi:hypothetical protein